MTNHKLKRIIKRNRQTMDKFDTFEEWKKECFHREDKEAEFKAAFELLKGGNHGIR